MLCSNYILYKNEVKNCAFINHLISKLQSSAVCIKKVQIYVFKPGLCVPITGPILAQRVGRGIALPFHDRRR